MAITIYNIKKWYRMLAGKSVLHVNQDIGKHFCKSELKGYYNNMKEKVSYMPHLVESEEMPIIHTETGRDFYFPVAIFQFSFGILDFYYETREKKYIDKFHQCAEWAVNNQLENGAWDNFSYIYKDNPYGAMAQGEGASLLIRAYTLFGDEKYMDAAKKAIDFMLLDVKEGGCTLYQNNDVSLLEYTHLPIVLNGWIFSWWGLYDYCLVKKDERTYKIMQDSLQTLIKRLPLFSNKYWSMYDMNRKIASPFYHNLHIAQMQAMHELTEEKVFDHYAKLWKRRQNNYICKTIAFAKKSFQKIIEK